MWKPVVGYEDNFLVSDDGQVKNLRTGTILKQHVRKNGYVTVSVKIGGRQGKSICFRVHRLVAEAFLPSPTLEQIEWAKGTRYRKVSVNHKDSNKQNNRVDNLEWATNSENMKHAFINDLLSIPKSEDAGQAKLTDEQVLEIRRRYKPGCWINGARAMSCEFGVSHTQISRVARGKRFKHLKIRV